MKESTICKFFLFFMILSNSVFASANIKEISREQAKGLQKIGTVSVSNVRGSYADAIKVLQNKAMAAGGTHHSVIALGTSGDSSHWRGNSIIYR